MTDSANQPNPHQDEMFEQIAAFEAAYDYDASYMRDLYQRSPEASRRFDAARSMASFHDHLPIDAHYTAAITVMQQEDCGGCLDLNFKLAREAGVSEDILESLATSPDELPRHLQDVREHTRLCLTTGAVDEQIAERIQQHYGEAAFAELAIGIVGARLYPGIKRALMKMQACGIREAR